MKMKLKEVNEYVLRLSEFGKRVFPSKLSFAISYNMEKLQKEAERGEKERLKLCGQYAEKDKEGKPVMAEIEVEGKMVQSYRLSAQHQREFAEEYRDLLETEVEVDIRKVSQEVLERCESSERYSIPSVADIAALAFMLEE